MVVASQEEEAGDNLSGQGARCLELQLGGLKAVATDTAGLAALVLQGRQGLGGKVGGWMSEWVGKCMCGWERRRGGWLLVPLESTDRQWCEWSIRGSR
jgi:hypothetical protein